MSACQCTLRRRQTGMAESVRARILAIETSCDETACAVLDGGRSLLASTVASQMAIHARFGGVFPEVASRQHVLAVVPVIEETLEQGPRDAPGCGCNRGDAWSGAGGFAGGRHECRQGTWPWAGDCRLSA